MKKNYFIALICMLLTFSAFADRDYLPIIKEGRKWIYFTSFPAQTKKGTYLHYEVGPTVEIDGKTYYEIKRYDSDTFDGEKQPVESKIYVREAGGKLYSRYHPSIDNVAVKDIPVIDMTPEKCEDLKFVFYDNDGQMREFGGSAVDITTLNVRGTQRKEIMVNDDDLDDWDAYWVEGIGASRLDWWVTEMSRPTIGIIYRLVGCYDGDECIFTGADFKPAKETDETYLPIIKEGRRWVYNYAVPVSGYDYDIVYEVAEPVICYGLQYYRVKESTEASDGSLTESDREFFLREENGKLIKRFHPDFDPEQERVVDIPLIDMTPRPGEDITTYTYNYTGAETLGKLTPKRIDNINARGVERKRITISDTDNIYWVEGIGSSTLDFWATEMTRPSRGIVYTFKGCYDGDECIFTAEDFTLPAAAIGDISDDAVAADRPEVIYDLQGRRVTAPRPGELYIVRRGATVTKMIAR